MKCEEIFEKMYNREADGIAFCPYRICPIGAHSDHQLGKITGLAINRGIHIAYGIKHNGVIELTSLQFEKRAQFHISQVEKTKVNDWADYLRGAAIELGKRHKLEFGMCGVIEGSLPIGGLSSSAAVIIAFLAALCSVNGIRLTDEEIIDVALAAENKYVGVSCGRLDQSCEVYSRKDHLLYLDTKDGSYELIPTNPNMKPYDILILFSGIERNLAGSKFNMRVDECRSAAYALKAYAGMDYGKFSETNLRDVPIEVFNQYADRLPDTWRKRARHWYTEFDRVQKGAAAWRTGDIDTFGALSFESGASSINDWETGSPELKKLYEIMLGTEGIYGGRFSGAGFKGCCMALVNPDYTEKIIGKITMEYIKEFPLLDGKFSACVCRSADGVKF